MKNELCVPVTRTTTLGHLAKIAQRFIREKLTFGIIEKQGTKFCIWRAALPGDLPEARNHSHDYANRIIRKPVPEEKIRYLWIQGELVQFSSRGIVNKYFRGE